ncbi:hypothetical protein FRB97_002913 [Tulasnella sp. 331]|nr:hypothetical protein FRB97_002913 [Tulasnella sp. 331]
MSQVTLGYAIRVLQLFDSAPFRGRVQRRSADHTGEERLIPVLGDIDNDPLREKRLLNDQFLDSNAPRLDFQPFAGTKQLIWLIAIMVHTTTGADVVNVPQFLTSRYHWINVDLSNLDSLLDHLRPSHSLNPFVLRAVRSASRQVSSAAMKLLDDIARFQWGLGWQTEHTKGLDLSPVIDEDMDALCCARL